VDPKFESKRESVLVYTTPGTAIPATYLSHVLRYEFATSV